MNYRILLMAALMTLTCGVGRADIEDPPPNPLAMTTIWSGPDNQFVTCAVADKTGWWWGTDNDGLWRFTPDAPRGNRWTHVRAVDGLYDDSITSLCYDRLGRLWVGTERRGVSVYNGSWWRNYDVMTGPLGVHVNAIVMEPATGDIWIGSEEGLAIYSETSHSWRYITRAEGLVSDKVTCLAFTKSGKVVVGTAGDGLMIGDPAADSRLWRRVSASPDAALTQVGSGLPGNLVNCLLVNSAGKIFCGTSTGLAESADDGAAWSYQHGWQWPQEISILAREEKPGRRDYVQTPLAEEFISCLAFDNAGHLYVGHRQRGCEIYDDAADKQIYHTPFEAHGTYLKAIVPTPRGGALLGNYAGGLSLVRWENTRSCAEEGDVPVLPAANFPQHPAPAAPPATEQLQELSSRLAAVDAETSSSLCYFLGEDWMTQGSWVGRYGADYAVICAENGNTDLVLSSTPGYSATPELGHSEHDNEDVSHWLYWSSTGDPRVLFDPATGVRRQAEWNDHGERYQMLYEGPDLWLTISVPEGEHRVSLYFMNKDGHTELTRFRDYIIQVRQFEPGVPIARSYDTPGVLPVLAQTRAENFWPGVYENFVVTGPSKYYIKIDKNFSINAMVQGIFIDRLDATPSHRTPSGMAGLAYSPEAITVSQPGQPENPALSSSARRLWTRLDTLWEDSSSAGFQREYRILALRAATAAGAPQEQLTAWRWRLGLWTDNDWTKFQDFMNRVRASLAAAKKP